MADDFKFEHPDLGELGTGLLVPESLPVGVFPPAEAAVPRMTLDQIVAELKQFGPRNGRKRWQWIVNQASTNACAGWGAIQALMRGRQARGQDHVPLSGSSVYCWANGGRDNGSHLVKCMEIIAGRGALPTSLSNINQIFTNQYPADVWQVAKRFRALPTDIYETRSEVTLATGLLLGFVGCVAVHVGRNYQVWNGQGNGGYVPAARGPGNHAVCVDGIEFDPARNQLRYDSPGSWSEGWGDRGRCYLDWPRHLDETNRYHVFYLIRSTTDDPQGPRPPAVR